MPIPLILFQYEGKYGNKLFHTNSGARNETLFYLLSHFLKPTLIVVILSMLKKRENKYIFCRKKSVTYLHFLLFPYIQEAIKNVAADIKVKLTLGVLRCTNFLGRIFDH